MTQRPAVFVIGSPVAGFIRPSNAPAIRGRFRVTSTFAQHVASGRPGGIDIGNFRCGEPVIAQHDGIVSLAGFIGAAKVVRIRHPNGTDESGFAHLATIEAGVVKGAALVKGQKIGTLGTTGASACHLHGGYKRNGVEIDWWKLLEQNHAVQVNASAILNLRDAPAGAIVGIARLTGIFTAEGTRLAEHDALMTVRGEAAVKMALGGVMHEWLPRKVGTLNFWVARNFVHFV